MFADGGEGDDDGFAVDVWQGVVHDFGEGLGEGTDGVVLEVVDELV